MVTEKQLKSVSTLITPPIRKMPKKLRNYRCRIKHCGGLYRWEPDGNQWVCWICGDRPYGWGGRGFENNQSTAEAMARGYTASSSGNSGNVRVPRGRTGAQAEVKTKPPERGVQTSKHLRASRHPVMYQWTHFMKWGRAEKFKMCLWPGCPNLNGKRIHCATHRQMFLEEFGESHPTWKQMQLWSAGGEIAISWMLDRLTGKQGDFFVKVVNVKVPDSVPDYGEGKTRAWVRVRKTFGTAMEYPVRNLSDAIKEAIKDRDAVGKERLA